MYKELDGFTRTYKVSEKYNVEVQLVDVDEPDERYEAWIFSPNICYKLFMFGMPTYQQDYDVFLEYVMNEWADYTSEYEDMGNAEW